MESNYECIMIQRDDIYLYANINLLWFLSVVSVMLNHVSRRRENHVMLFTLKITEVCYNSYEIYNFITIYAK